MLRAIWIAINLLFLIAPGASHEGTTSDVNAIAAGSAAPGALKQKRFKHGKLGHARRIALIWTFNARGGLPYYLELSLATLINSGADNVDVHILTPAIPEIYTNGSNPNYSYMRQVYFHTVSAQDWTDRVRDRLGVELKYDFASTHRKLADLKPMMGFLFQDLIPPEVYDFWAYGDCDGLFGSFNRLLDLHVLSTYDVVSGFPLATGQVQVLGGVPLRATGALTMWRNVPKINSLFMRSVNWRSMLLNGDLVYAFDEHSRPKHDGEEDMHQVLEFSHDVRQCCMNHRQPYVKRGADTAFITEMMGRFVETNNSTIYITWRRGQGLSVVADGHYGFGERYKREGPIEVLFLHFLQWKYTCGAELDVVLKGIVSESKKAGKTIFEVDCIQIEGTYKHSFLWRFC